MSKVFREALAAVNPTHVPERWVYAAYDQCTFAVGPLADADPARTGVLLVECPGKPARRPYHKQKLALILANLRHFALELAQAGYHVRWRVADSYRDAVAALIDEVGSVTMMEAAERELREELQPLVDAGGLRVVANATWCTTDADFDTLGAPPWRMDAFYRGVRRRTGVLMEGGKPVGGRFSHDGDNREPWRGEPAAPAIPTFTPDAVTREVAALVDSAFPDHPGAVDLLHLPACQEDAEALWRWAKASCLPSFGPYEDALSRTESNLFHTRVSAVMHLGRILPRRAVDEVCALDVPINSREGFVRQVLGWREYVRHVHRKSPDMAGSPNVLGQRTPLPPVFWGGAPSGLACLDGVVEDVWREGFSHHITRLMVLSNTAQLLDVDPRELTDWFWVAYIDAYDWVVEPNVLGMATFAVGDRMTTKPYVAGSGYVHRMGDYCAPCRFHPKKSCPLTPMYWAYLARHRESLSGVDRAVRQLLGLDRRSETQRAADRRTYERVREALGRGEALEP
ncbi:MAG: cryptochrome/photolyase family protein [Alphaproteobacteria bacterium]|nr:cryptochrome/photolyase family protein [Alphaproteobacteria bacterium]